MALQSCMPVSLGRMSGVPGLSGETKVGESQVRHYLGGAGQGRGPSLVDRLGVRHGQPQQNGASQAEAEKHI
jgi:hypothetical protein